MTTGFIPSLFNWSPSNICHIIWAQLKNSKKSSYLVGGGFPKLCRWHTWYPYNTHIYPTRPLRQKLSPGLKDSDKQGIIVLQGCGRWAGCDELLVMRWHGGLEGDINEVARKWRQPHPPPPNALALPRGNSCYNKLVKCHKTPQSESMCEQWTLLYIVLQVKLHNAICKCSVHVTLYSDTLLLTLLALP